MSQCLDMSNHGVINLLKPPGMTSHDAVAHVRRVLKTKRVGHTGTLDPAAAGVLPICVGLATRLVESLQSGTKEYLAEATFGYETDTLDAVGETIRVCDASSLSVEQLERACEKFRGEIQQQPPLHSAIKIGGQKLYELARAGGDIEIPSRSVTISGLEITRFFAGERPRAFLRIECSSGTYIRSLVRDIGRALGNAATMTFLSRVRNGKFDLADAVTPEELERAPVLLTLPNILVDLYGSVHMNDELAQALWQGKRVFLSGRAENQLLIGNRQGNLIVLAVNEGANSWKPSKVFDLRQI